MRSVSTLISLSHGGLLIIPSPLIMSSLLQSKIVAAPNQEVIIRVKSSDGGIIIDSDISAKDVAGRIKEVLKRKFNAILILFYSFKSSRYPTFKIIDSTHSSDAPRVDSVYPFLRNKALSASMLFRAFAYTAEVSHSTTCFLRHNGTIEAANEKFANASREKRTVLAACHIRNSGQVASFEEGINKSPILEKSLDNMIIEVIANISKVVLATYSKVKDRKQTGMKIILETLNARKVRQEASSVISTPDELSDPIILAAFLPIVIRILALGIISRTKTLAKARGGALLLLGQDGQRFHVKDSILSSMNTGLRLISLSYMFMVLA